MHPIRQSRAHTLARAPWPGGHSQLRWGKGEGEGGAERGGPRSPEAHTAGGGDDHSDVARAPCAQGGTAMASGGNAATALGLRHLWQRWRGRVASPGVYTPDVATRKRGRKRRKPTMEEALNAPHVRAGALAHAQTSTVPPLFFLSFF